MGSSVRGARDGLYRILRQQRPSQVVAIDNAGKATTIALREGKGRWDGVVDAAFAMLGQLDRLELRNEKGEVWRTWTPPEVADDDDDEREEPRSTAPATAPSTREDEIFRMGVRYSEHVQRACNEAIERHLAGTQAIVDALIQVVKAQNERILQQDRGATNVLKALYEATTAKAEAQVALTVANNGPQQSPADRLMERVLLGAFAGGDDEPEAEQTPAVEATAAEEPKH